MKTSMKGRAGSCLEWRSLARSRSALYGEMKEVMVREEEEENRRET